MALAIFGLIDTGGASLAAPAIRVYMPRVYMPRTAMKLPFDDLPTGTGATVGGAVLGGLLAGPFGAIFGSQIGGAIGQNRQKEKQLAQLGITREVLQGASDCVRDLGQAEEDALLVQRSIESQQQLLLQLDDLATEAYDAAAAALQAGDEATARRKLEEKQRILSKQDAAESDLGRAREQLRQAKHIVQKLEVRAKRIEAMLEQKLSAGNQPISGGATLDAELAKLEPPEDPLESKFRDLESRP
eukprot:CAMPEP_0119326434 /NCGR_PEP_ID=MMETSP1333-20130426/68389_1 /TAXON_ID=418940 /ORGANISM="Scyphosphaera apsteinii, Strain RCC1455" /LENGTH=243 /DNA_ID=CAMNT_0007334743 /DNA_START=29 /DNA_END=760 /DNA_ORIENTATION=-